MESLPTNVTHPPAPSKHHELLSDPPDSTTSLQSSSHSILENVHSAPIDPPSPILRDSFQARIAHLKDHVTQVTVYPITAATEISPDIISVLLDEFNQEIRRGDTYPMEEELSYECFVNYWFGTFAAIMLQGTPEDHGELTSNKNWKQIVLGTFYIRPNYPGRSSHICNAGLLTMLNARGRGCGRILAESYLEYAPKLGFTYSVFNLVFESNIPSVKIWDSLGFKRIGLVKGAGRLRSYPNQFIDAIIYGRDLKFDEDYVSEERFDKIRYYLEKGKYPPTADRSEKSRLRSAATHYRIVDGKLMLKDKEVISDSQKQYEIAKSVHSKSHGGINKTTANIAERYHWVRIKETVSQVIRNCPDCKEHGKIPSSRGERSSPPSSVNSSALKKQAPVVPDGPELSGIDLRQLQRQDHVQILQHQERPESERKQSQVQPQQGQQLHMQSSQQKSPRHQIRTRLLPPNGASGSPLSVHMASPLAVSQPLILPHEQVDATRAAAVAAAAGIEIPVDPQMMEGIEQEDHHNPLIHQFAPVASMHSVQLAVAAARAALHEGGEALSDDRAIKDQHLMETLAAELKREGYGDEDGQ